MNKFVAAFVYASLFGVTAAQAAAIKAACPRTNPVTTPFTTATIEALPTISANQTIFVRSTGSDANSGLTVGSPKLTIVGALAAVTAGSGVWKIDVAEAGTFVGANATVGHQISKLMTAGGKIYICGNSRTTTFITGPVGATSTVSYTGNTAYIEWRDVCFGNGTDGSSNGLILYTGSAAINNISYVRCNWNAGAAGWCFFYNNPTSAAWRGGGNYVGDHAFKECLFSDATRPCARIWCQGGGGSFRLAGFLWYACTASNYTSWANRCLISEFIVDNGCVFAHTAATNHAFQIGENTNGSILPNGGNTGINGAIMNSIITSSEGHAVIISDNFNRVYCYNLITTTGGAGVGTNKQGIVFKNCIAASAIKCNCSGDCGSTAAGNTVGPYNKGSMFVYIEDCDITVNNYGIGVHVGADSNRPGCFTMLVNNRVRATGNAGAKCVGYDAAGGSDGIIIANDNAYRADAGGVLALTTGRVTGTTIPTLQASWLLNAIDSEEKYNDSRSTLATV